MEDFLSKQLQKAFEGGSIHTAEKDGKFYIIQDEQSLAGFLSEEDLQGLESDLFKVMEFETNSERSAYMSQRGWVRFFSMGAYYNGYSWKQREGILEDYKRLIRVGTTQALGYLLKKSPCEMCADSDCSIAWHSEDYSWPYLFSPPSTFNICAVCHLRLHKRFNQPWEWLLYLEHLKSGGFGREFVKLYSVHQRKAWIDSYANGSHIDLPPIRKRHLTTFEWWLNLSLDPESLVAPWARPRPWRPRPSTDMFKAALATVKISASELALLTAHARSPRRTATMRQLAIESLGSNNPQIANLLYGRLCRRLSELLLWTPDRRSDGSPIWLSIAAEGWQPPKREFEWVLVPSLQVLFTEMKSLPLIPAKEWPKSDKSKIGKYGFRPSE